MKAKLDKYKAELLTAVVLVFLAWFIFRPF